MLTERVTYLSEYCYSKQNTLKVFCNQKLCCSPLSAWSRSYA